MILRLEGHSDRMAARSLGGQEMFVLRDQAPELGPDEWWAEDLVGCVVRDVGALGGVDGGALGGVDEGALGGEPLIGTVSRLVALPSCEALEVARPQGAPVLLVPLVRDAVRGIDLERRTIAIDLRFLGER